VAEGFKTIAANPQPEVRKLQIEQFPFSLLYVERADYIWVVAIAHGSRKPGYWKDRIS
jgi:toxin ParE1/3/4